MRYLLSSILNLNFTALNCCGILLFIQCTPNQKYCTHSIQVHAEEVKFLSFVPVHIASQTCIHWTQWHLFGFSRWNAIHKWLNKNSSHNFMLLECREVLNENIYPFLASLFHLLSSSLFLFEQSNSAFSLAILRLGAMVL